MISMGSSPARTRRRRRSRLWIPCLLLSMASLPVSAEFLLTVSPGGGQRPADPLLRTIDSSNGATLRSVSMVMTGFTVVGGSGLARHPETGTLYALLKVEGSSFRRLAILLEESGVAIDLGDTGRRFAGMAFGADGTLYAVTGDGSGIAETLFTLDLEDASSAEFVALGAGSDGETIAFNPDDGSMYHASGIGTPNHPNGERFDFVDLDTLEITNVPLSGFDYEELSALVYRGGGFFAGDVGSASSDAPRFFSITTGGSVTLLGNMDHVAKGMAPAEVRAPSLGRPALGCLVVLFALGAWRVHGATRPGLRDSVRQR